jgi:SAM-dependent methyltransferase
MLGRHYPPAYQPLRERGPALTATDRQPPGLRPARNASVCGRPADTLALPVAHMAGSWGKNARAVARNEVTERRQYGGAMQKTTAASEGVAWSAVAAGWVEYFSGFSAPAYEAVARAIGLAAGDSVLDVGCGGGEFCALAAARGARVSGIDAAEGMIELAKRRLDGAADLRVGPLERLPWADATFDVVTGFNAFELAADRVTDLAEAARVVRSGGRVAICSWGLPEDCEVHEVFGPLAELKPKRPGDARAVGQEKLARQAGLVPVRAGEVEVPYEFPDRATLGRAMLALAPVYGIGSREAERVVDRTLATAAEPFRRGDGSYRFENRFRYLIAAVP